MTEYELNAFQSEFDPVKAADSLQADNSRENKIRNFAVLKTSYFLAYTKGPGRLAVLNKKDGTALIAVFTNRAELEKWPFEKQEVGEIPFETLNKMVRDNARLEGIVINPFGASMTLRRPQLSDIDLTMRAAAGAGEKRELRLKATRDYPMGLPAALRALMEEHPEVYRVWLVAAHAEGEHTDHKLFIVDFDGKKEGLFPLIGQAVRPYLREGEPVEMLKADLALLRVAEQAAKPMYVKE